MQFKYTPDDFDDPVKEEMEVVYKSVEEKDFFKADLALDYLHQDLKMLGSYIISMAEAKEMQGYFHRIVYELFPK